MKVMHLGVTVILFSLSAWSETIYKCPGENNTIKFQQMPCSLQGGGEIIDVKPMPKTGLGLTKENYQFLQERATEQAEAKQKAKEEDERQDALNIERAKVSAARAQARAQQETAQAIWANTAVQTYRRQR